MCHYDTSVNVNLIRQIIEIILQLILTVICYTDIDLRIINIIDDILILIFIKLRFKLIEKKKKLVELKLTRLLKFDFIGYIGNN